MRKFYIQAGNGLRYDLQDKAKCFLNNPTGLGFSKDNSYVSVGNYFSIDNSKNEQKNIEGNLIFCGNWYANFNEFITFIKSYDDYKLVYKYDETDYYIDIDIISVEKGDTGGNKYLECNLQMKSKSLWYKTTSITRDVEHSDNLTQWDWNFDLLFNDIVISKIDINNKGQTKTPYEFELTGSVEDVTLEIYKDGIMINDITFNVTLQANESLLYGNEDNNLYVYKKSGNTLTNIFDSLDLTKDNWVKLPIGESSLQFTSDIGDISSVKITYYEEFEAV